MIIYYDDSNSKAINSLIEYDYIKKLPPQYTLNILTKDKKSNKKGNTKINKKSQISSNLNYIQRELINLLSFDLEQNGGNEELQKESKPELNQSKFTKDNNISNLNDSTNANSSLMKDIKYMNNPLYENKIRNKLYNKSNQIYYYYMNIPLNNKNKNDNIGYKIDSNIINPINNSINNPMSYNINNQISNEFNNSFIINNPINNINKSSINNSLYINCFDIDENINNNFIKDENYYNNYINVFSQNNPEINMSNMSYIINNNNIENQQFNIIFDKNSEDNINNINNNINKLNNLKNSSNKSNINYTNNINVINNLNFINNMYDYNNHMSKIGNTSNNDLSNYLVNNYQNMTLLKISNKLDIIAKNQIGCRYLEYLIQTNENSYEITNKIFFKKLYWEKLLELSNAPFGNYFIQAIIPELDSINLISFKNLVNNNLLKLCLNPHGTRVVQVLIDNIKDNKCNLLILFTKYLSRIMGNLINDLNGSFVLLHYAEEIEDNDIIYNFLNKNIVEICLKSYSCSALQKFIDLGSNKQKYKIINNIINNLDQLIGSQCGLYVLQFIMNKKDYQINDIILQKIIHNLIKYSKQKYSSNVIEKCLETCSPNGVNKIIEILKNDIIIRDLIKDIFGNYVIQKLLIVCPDDRIRSHILDIIASEFNELTKLSFGNKLIKKLLVFYPEIKKKYN